MNIYLQKYNILESSTVTVSSEDSDYPKYRLYDRDIGLLFKSQSYTGDFIIHIDQGSTTYPINTLIIPAGHNLDGLTCYLEYSDDDSAWEAVGNGVFTPSDTDLIAKEFPTSYDHRYWRLRFNVSSFVVEVPEIMLFQNTSIKGPVVGHNEEFDRNFARIESIGGKPYFFEKSSQKQHFVLDLVALTDENRRDIETLLSDIEGGKPFYFYRGVANLIDNPDFEDSTDPDWWTRKSSDVLIETSGGSGSNQWMKFTRSGGDAASFAAETIDSTTQRYIEVNPGDIYKFGADIKTDGTCEGKVGIGVYDKDKGDVTWVLESSTSTSWENKTHRYTVPSGKRYISLFVGAYTNDGWAGFDNVFLKRVDSIEGEWKFVELVRDPIFTSTSAVKSPWRISLDLKEVLA